MVARRATSTRILCATDLLPKSEAAVERAGMLANRLMFDLSLLHVVVPAESERALEHDLQHAIGQVEARSQPPRWRWARAPNVIVTTGQPSTRIIDTVDETGASLVVLGPHRRRMATDALRGTIAEKLLSARAAPLLIVKRAPRTAYRNVLVALDLSQVSAAALRAAESFAMTAETHAVIVHAHEPHYEGMLTYAGIGEEAIDAYGRRWSREMESAVRELLRREGRDFTRFNVILEKNPPVAGILSAAGRVNPDLLVLGTRGHGRLRRALLGSVANRVLKAASCDVLMVPDGSLRRHQTRRGTPAMPSGHSSACRSQPPH